MVLEGPHASRRIYTRIGLGQGVRSAEDIYANRGRALIRGILESAARHAGKDDLRRARAARNIRGYGDLNGLEFVAKVGIEQRPARTRTTRAATSSPRRSAPSTPTRPPMGGGHRHGRPCSRRHPDSLRPAPSAVAAPSWAVTQQPQAGTRPATRLSGPAEGQPGHDPRDYQRAAVGAARAKTAEHGNTISCCRPGRKTAIAGFYIGEEAAQERDGRFLMLQHTDELIEQNRATVGAVTGLTAAS